MRPRRSRAFVIGALLLAPSFVDAQAAPTPPAPPPTGTGPTRYPTQRWEQVFSPSRIGDRITAFAVFYDNPLIMFVGTEETTVYRTIDGGQTWLEANLGPFNTLSRRVTMGFESGGRSDSPLWTRNQDPSGDQQEARTATFSLYRERLGTLDILAAGVDPLRSFSPRRFLLENALTRHRDDTTPIQRIAVCPGARYEVLVATTRDLFGSDDGGQTFHRLMPGALASVFIDDDNTFIYDVNCSPTRPNDLVVPTVRGVMRSIDGGLSWTYVTTVNGQATAANWDEGGMDWENPENSAGAPLAMLAAMNVIVFIGDPDSPEGLQYVYPDWDNPALAPYTTINWLQTTAEGEVWLATNSGVRVSRDGGVTWEKSGEGFMKNEPITQVIWGDGFNGGSRMVASGPHAAFATDDAGRTWFPYWGGLSRRTIQVIDCATPDETGEGRWYVATSGEVWRTVEPTAPSSYEDPELRAYARAELDAMQPLDLVLEQALSRAQLRGQTIQLVSEAQSAWVPRARLTFAWRDTPTVRALSQGPEPFFSDWSFRREEWGIFASLAWDLRDTVFVNNMRARELLINLRQEISEAVEDVWHERQFLLTRLAYDVLVDPLAAYSIRERVAALDAALEIWCGDQFRVSRQ